ncbi:MAG: hypothetical protein HZB53_09805 [Chloroflexi bacterium]|nr:hypothetical protein [Chloroflexota bacterium]
MNQEKAMINTVDRKGLYRLGGISAIVLGLSYILITVVYVLGGALPSGAEEWLKYLVGHTTAWWTILALSALTDFLFLPVALALTIALKEVNRNAVLAGASLIAMFAILDLTVTWPNYASLITLSGKYAAVTSDVQRTVIVAAATYAWSVLNSSLFAVYAILVPSLGILIIGLAMLKGVFNKATAYSGLATGILGIVAVVGPFVISALGAIAIIASVFTTVWVLLAGVSLCQLD